MDREMDSTCKYAVSRARWDKVVDRDTLESFIQVVLSVCSENGYSAETMNGGQLWLYQGKSEKGQARLTIPVGGGRR